MTVAGSLALPFAAGAQPRDRNPALDEDYTPPRTEWGHPDMRGVWNFSSNTPTQRPQDEDREFLTPEEVVERDRQDREEDIASDGQSSQGGVGGYNQFWVEGDPQDLNLRSSIIISNDGRLPPRVEGAPVAFGGLGPDIDGERPVRFTVGGIGKRGPEDRGLSERCLIGFNAGPPFQPSMYNNNVQLFQNRDHVVILNEMIHHARIVRLGEDEASLPDDVRQWTGDSRGYWDGDTLVVETDNFNAKTQSYYGTGIAADMHLTERFTRVAEDRIQYEFTVDDPEAFTEPVTGTFPLFASEERIHEYACHEGNYGMVNTLRGARVEEGLWDRENNRVIQPDDQQ